MIPVLFIYRIQSAVAEKYTASSSFGIRKRFLSSTVVVYHQHDGVRPL